MGNTMGNEKAHAKTGKVSRVRQSRQSVKVKVRADENKLPGVRGVLGQSGLKERVEYALNEWKKMPIGHPVCILTPTEFCILPSGHAEDHSWVPLPDQP